jgi:signal peptidase I
LENSLSDQLANISPVIILALVMALTLIRLFLSKIQEGWARTVAETCDTLNFVLIFAFLLIRPFVAQAFYIPSESMENTLLVQDRLIVDKVSYRFHEPKRGDVIVFEAPPEATDDHQEGVDFIKRLIGLPGDTILVKAAQLKIDGEVVVPDRDLHSYLRDHLSLGDGDAVKIYPDHLLVNGKQTVELTQLAQSLGRPGSKIELTPGETILNGKIQDEPYTREDPDYNFPENGVPLKIEPEHLFMMGDNRNHSRDSHAWGPLERHRVIGHATFIFLPISRVGAIR